MSSDKPLSPPPAPPKPRSAVERTLVWGGILILLVLVGIEYTAKNAQSAAVETLLARIKEAEETPLELKAAEIKSAHVKAAVGNKVPRVEDVSAKLLAIGAKRVEVYQWFSINPMKKREMYVYYGAGDDPDVLSVSTEEETESILAQYPELSETQKEGMRRNASARSKPAPAQDDAAGIAAGDNASADDKQQTKADAARVVEEP